MSRTEPPKELKQELPHDPRLWARNYLRHPNDPARAYDFWDDIGPKQGPDDEEGEFLYYLVDDEGPMNPDQWGDINILLFARGCLKTWTTTTITAWALDMYPSLEFAATAPVDDQRGEVIDRFKNKAMQSGLADRRTRDNQGHQKFQNTTFDRATGEKYTAYSHLKSRSAWNAGDKLRGIHAHGGLIDEAQLVDEGTFSTFLEAIDRQVPQVDYFPTIFIIGTPTMANTFFHRLWKMSDKKTWDGEAKEWITQDEPDEFLPQELEKRKAELAENIAELESMESPDEDLIEELQSEHDAIEGFTVRGWHVDQPNSPLHDQTQIAFKQETYSKKKFENEVLANFHTPDHDLITNDNVWDAFEDDLRERSTPMWPETDTYLAVDWGGGQGEGAASTVIAVAEKGPDGDHIYPRKVDVLDASMSSKDERDRIDEYMEQYDVDLGIVDEGYGDTDREELQDEYGYDENSDQTIYGCWFGNVTKKEEVTWNRFNDEKRFFTAAKSYVAKSMAEDFSDGMFVLPKASYSFDTKRANGTRLVEQLTAPYTEKKETSSGRNKIEVKSDRADDIFDVFMYLWIASEMLSSNREVRTIASHNRAGY